MLYMLLGWKISKTLARKTGRKTWCWLIESRSETFWIKNLSTISKSGVTKGTTISKALMWHFNFCFSYWLLCLDGCVFISVFWRPLAWPLVERSLGMEKSLLVFPNASYKKCWSTSGGVWLPIKAPRCFLLLGSFFKKRGSRDLVFGCCLLIGHIPHCWWLFWPHIPYHLLPQTPSFFLALVDLCYPLAPSW